MDLNILLQQNVMQLFPKVELHRHLEGSFCLDTLYEIAVKNNIPNISREINKFKADAQFPKNHKPDFKLFLSKFRNDWYRSYEDIYKLVYNSVKQFKDEALYFIELRFSPEHFALYNDFNRIEITKIIVDSSKKAANEANIKINFIITFNRNKQTQQQMLDLYKNLYSHGLSEIGGIDLAGDETVNPPEEFTDFFDAVHSDGIGITIHAGEVTPPKQIWAAIDLLHADRVGHGTMSIKDRKLQDELIKRKIILEQCPVSNYYTGSCVDTPNHPFKMLYKRGVLVTLNSDDPTIQNATLTDDFITAVKYFDIDYQKLLDLNIRSLQGSFVDKKNALIKGYNIKIKEFEKQLSAIQNNIL